MRILVTGASGFVGYAVATLLPQCGHDVLGLTRSATLRLPGHVQRVHGSLRPETLLAALEDVDGVCHLAARTRVRESYTHPLGYWQTNVGGTLALLHATSATGTQRLVLASTCGVYGDQTAGRPTNESTPAAPNSPYGTSKLAADNAAMDLASTGAIGATSLRAFNIAGALPSHPDPGRDPAHSPHDGRPARHRTRTGRERRR